MRVKGQLWSTYAVAALAAVSLLVSAAVQAAETVSDAAALVDISKIRIDNFGRINATYYRGEQPEGRDYGDLASLGIKTVIDLQADGQNDDEQARVEAAGMTFYRIPMTTHVEPTTEQVGRFLQIVNDAAQQPVYVHCKGGKHRTGVMTAVYRMEHDGWSSEQAFNEMKQYKFGLDLLHSEFKRFVYAYQPGNLLLAQAAKPVMSTK